MFEHLKIDDTEFNTFLKNERILRSILSLAHHNGMEITDKKEKQALDYVGLSIEKLNTKEAARILLTKGSKAMQRIIEQL